MDSVHLGAVFRAVRVRRRWRQQDVAVRAGISRASVGRAENGQAHLLTFAMLLKIATCLGIRLELEPSWRGGDMGRLMSAGHSAMHQQIAVQFDHLGPWLMLPEVSFSIYGERGVIDILAFQPHAQALLVIELKTELVDVQALLGTTDRYTRLARRVATERGWRAESVSCWVVLRDTMTNRRRVAAHAAVLRAALPSDGREMRRWLRDPAGSIRALSFLSDAHVASGNGHGGGVKRVRVRRGTAPEHATAVEQRISANVGERPTR